MKRFLLILALLMLPLPVSAASPSPSPSMAPIPKPNGGELWINELLPNPAGTDTGNEWIELKNASAKTLDVGGIKVKRQSGTTLVTVPTGTILSAGEVFLATASGSMVNGGDTLELWTDTAKVDQVTYDTAEDGLAWVRLGETEGAWSAAGTPGEENPSDVSFGDDGGGSGVTDPSSAATRTSGPAVGSSAVSRRTASALAKRGPIPQAGIGLWAYALPILLATLYAYRTRTNHDH